MRKKVALKFLGRLFFFLVSRKGLHLRITETLIMINFVALIKNGNMDIIQLKSGIYSLIDQIENVELLKDYYFELEKIIKSGKSGIWYTLSEEQKNEVLLSYAESEMEENLIDENVVMEKYKKWL